MATPISKKKRTLLFIGLVLGTVLLGLAACDSGSPASTPNAQDVQQSEQDINAAQRAKLAKAEPYPQVNDSSELANLRQYYLRTADPNAVNYVYILSPYGQVIAEYQTVGKCTSTESVYSVPQSVVTNDTGTNGIASVTVPAPQPDGSYGQNGNGLICFINDAKRSMFILYQGSNTLLWSQEPLGLTTQPVIQIVPNGK